MDAGFKCRLRDDELIIKCHFVCVCVCLCARKSSALLVGEWKSRTTISINVRVDFQQNNLKVSALFLIEPFWSVHEMMRLSSICR